MEKCGPSVQDLLDNKVQLSAKNLYALVLAVLQGLEELFERHKRSHGEYQGVRMCLSKVWRGSIRQHKIGGSGMPRGKSIRPMICTRWGWWFIS